MKIQELAAKKWDLIIAGAGIAGAFLAYRMAQQGYAVLLVEKESFGRSKVCGGYLSANAVEIFRAAGLREMLDALNAPVLNTLNLSYGGQSTHIPVAGGLAICRALLDGSLIEMAISAGATFLPDTVVSPGVSPGESSVSSITVRLKRGTDLYSCSSSLVVSAEGLNSSFFQKVLGEKASIAKGSLTGAGVSTVLTNSPYQPGIIYMVAGVEGYLGMVLTQQNQLTLAAALDVSQLKRNGGVVGSIKALFGQATFPEPEGWESLSWKGTVLLTREATKVSAVRVFAVGDAASYVEPFSGEGMTWGLHSVEALIPILCRALVKWEPHYVTLWQHRYQTVIRPMQRRSLVIASLLRKPRLCKGVLKLVRTFPTLSAPFTSAWSYTSFRARA